MIARLILMIGTGQLILMMNGCQGKTPSEPATPEIPPFTRTLPPLADAIPFEFLGGGKLVFERIGPYPGSYQGIYVVDIDGQHSRGIVGSNVPTTPSVSPDGQRIAFTMYAGYQAGTAYDVHIMNIGDSTGENVTYMQGQDRYPSWMPDGLTILFWVGEGSTRGMYMQSPVLEPLDRVMLSNLIIPAGMDYIEALSGPVSASINGELAYASYGYSSGIHTMNVDRTNWRLLVPRPSNQQRIESPAFSPDGQKIAYLSVVRDTRYRSIDIMLTDKDSANSISLMSLGADGQDEWSHPGRVTPVSLCWSPDGSKLLFTRPEGDFVSHIYAINSDGSGLTQVTLADSVTDRNVSWSR